MTTPARNKNDIAGTTSYVAWNAFALAFFGALFVIAQGALETWHPVSEGNDPHPAYGWLYTVTPLFLAVWFFSLIACATGHYSDAPIRDALNGRRPLKFARFARIGVLAWARRSFGIQPGLFGAFQPALLDVALLWAVAYPIGGGLVIWALWSWPMMLGSFEAIPGLDAFWPLRAVVLSGVGLFVFLLIMSARAATKGRASEFWWRLGTLTLAGAGTLAVAFAGPVAGAVAVAFAGALASAFASAVAGAFAVAGTLTLVGAVESLRNREKPKLAYGLLILVLSASVIIALEWVPWEQTNSDNRSLFVFLAILPLLNGLFDFLSYGTTLTLIRRGRSSSIRALWLAFADLGLALLYFLLLGCTLIAAVHGANRLGEETFFDLPTFFADMAAPATRQNHAWVFLMVFSTLLPTLLHVLASTISLPFGLPRDLRNNLTMLVEDAAVTPRSMIWAPLMLTLFALGWIVLLVITILAPAVFLFGWADIPGWAAPAINGYFGIFESWAELIGALPAP